MNPKKRGNHPKKKTFLHTLLKSVKKILTILFAMGIDKHLDYDQDKINTTADKKEKKKVD